ncbi:MAG TPA: GGDEF domain-containing protein [Anaeromyxobacteraceae bacterium]|nr:GGDEF domain-containing protein [Anaeromyxobacteraceae bacterium]
MSSPAEPPSGERTDSWSLAPRPHSERRPYLLVLSGPQFGEMFALDRGVEQVLGREAGVPVRLRDAGVSRRHASVFPTSDGARLRDLGSQNGTYVDGLRVTDCRLQDGQRVHLGMHSTLKYCLCDELEIEYQRRLAEGALQDPLTGLYNRRHFGHRLSAELAAVQRHGRPLSVLFLDVDHFGRVNDAHGEVAGDEALKMIAHVIQGAVRREDVLARLGSEDFAVLARETAVAGGRALADRVRKAVERSRLSYRGQELSLTMSVGVAVVSGIATYEPAKTDRVVLEAAEEALRQAKAAGGNAVAASPPLSLA